MQASGEQQVVHHHHTQRNCCRVYNASCPVIGARAAAITNIIVHVIALVCFGWLFWEIYLASLIAWVMGGVLLCNYTKCAYTICGLFFLLGCALDIAQAVWWFDLFRDIDEGGDDWDDVEEYIAWLILPPAIGAGVFGLGGLCALVAVCTWKKDDGPPEVITSSSAQVRPGKGGDSASVITITSERPQVKLTCGENVPCVLGAPLAVVGGGHFVLSFPETPSGKHE
ncbi:unnamed protein product [Ectocarpus sp. 4 AP-2014]